MGAGVTAIGTGGTGVAEAGQVLKSLGFTLGLAMMPVVGIMVLAALFGVLIQGETVVSAERIKPKISKLNPLSGFKRLFSADAFVEFAKNTARANPRGVALRMFFVLTDLPPVKP